jgi:predicted nucleic acid-binding protein
VAFPAYLDTCVLYPAYLCDTLLRLAEAAAFRPLWSPDVMEELARSLVKRGIAADRVDRRISQMTNTFPDAMVTGYETLVQGMTNDPKDRHVLAAAVRANAEVLVTFNLGDFPAAALEPFDIAAVHPDDFLLDQLDLYPGLTLHVLQSQAASYRREPKSVLGLLVLLERSGLHRFASQARRHL